MELFGGILAVKAVVFLTFSIFAIAAVGYSIGRIEVKGIDLGTAGVFIVALVYGCLLYTKLSDNLMAGEVTFADNEQMKGLFNVIDLMLSYGLPDSLSYSWNETCSAFATGQAAMTFEGDWIWSTVEPIDPEIECGMFPVPVSDNPDEAKLLVDTNMVLHIGKGSKEPEAAKEFLNWMATSDTAREVLLQDYQFVPCFEGWEYEGTNQLAASTKEYMSSGKASLWWWQKWPDGFRANAGQELQKYISGDATADETLKAIDVLWGNMAN